MTATQTPRVLVVDDEPDAARAQLASLRAAVELIIRAPDDVLEQDLVGARVVLVDYRIDDWPGRDELMPVSLRPLDGLALAAVLRSHLARAGTGTAAIALNAADLDELAVGSPGGAREEVLAQFLNLEWAFRKVAGPGPVSQQTQILSLAGAVESLPREWPRDDQRQLRRLISELLALPAESPWAEQAWEDIEHCRPPIHDSASTTHGLAFLRWLLHRILPYPCFLYSSVHLAHSLRVTPQSLRKVLSSGERRLPDKLAELQFTGVLSEFLGCRWWKAGIERLVWTLTGGNPFDRNRLGEAVRDQLSRDLIPTQQPHPVVCLDERLRYSDLFEDRGDAVEIQPDDWPSYAQPPWIPLSLAREDSRLGALVVEEDRERLLSPEPNDERNGECPA